MTLRRSMLPSDARWVVAAAIAAAAAFVAAISWPRPVPRSSALPEEEISPETFLTRELLDRQGTPDAIPAILKKAAQRIEDLAQQSAPGRKLSREQLASLTSAFCARLHLLLEPNFDRDAATMENDGYRGDRQVLKQRFESMRALYENTKHSAVGLQNIMVSFQGDGLLNSELLSRRGFHVIYGSNKNAPDGSGPFPDLPANTADELVVEVLVPMEASPLDVVNKRLLPNREVILAGYRYYWNKDSSKWIPLSSVICSRTNLIFLPLPVFF